MAVIVASASALSVSANSVSAEQVSGTYQFTGAGKYSLYAKSSATGMNVTCIIGGTNLVVDSAIPFTGTAGTLDTSANPLVSQTIYGLSNKAELKFRNTTGGALTVDYILLWDPILGGVFRRR
jgi:hypothetical protein